MLFREYFGSAGEVVGLFDDNGESSPKLIVGDYSCIDLLKANKQIFNLIKFKNLILIGNFTDMCPEFNLLGCPTIEYCTIDTFSSDCLIAN